MAERDFYFLRNIEAKCGDSYSAINEAFQEVFAQVRLGPPLSKKGTPDMTLKDYGYAGVYIRNSERVLVLRERYGEAKITLQMAESKLEKIIQKGVENVGYEHL